MASEHQGKIKHPETDGRLKENREAGRTMGTTPGSRERQEKAGHSSAEERHASGGTHGGQHSGGGRDRGAESGDLKSREYKDEHGNTHHHTRTYEEQHGKHR
jgi:hypothetical protein